MESAFEKYIQSYFGIPPETVTEIVSYFQPMTLGKGEYFLKEGAKCDKMGFVQSGIMREYLIEEQGREVTKWISTSGYFVVDIAAFLFHSPARWNLQALSDCELLVIHQKDYAQIGQKIPQWTELEKLFIARCFTILEQRIVTHLSLTSEERYELFFTHHRELFNLVPLQYLASMLGMTPETFSRIRNKLAKRTS
ncbi:Crp/Fnr family transcriptional regulator [Runella salmonicolor]|uniref:Crp/Fnr family transcriptional regulator n=1 Tax=Runella salmonicolor TaxID=2950278 RepID=A0ABT1FX21_9BACT|nr:Crp/Fnr family transcriptional regulator [Runella salmonicolor]MCP1386318.1 Crp/Fnr family transcriptional regulator [Runella salmonicolor]